MSASTTSRFQKYVPPYGMLFVQGYVHAPDDKQCCGHLHADPRESCSVDALVRPAEVILDAKGGETISWEPKKHMRLDLIKEEPAITTFDVTVYAPTADEIARLQAIVDARLRGEKPAESLRTINDEQLARRATTYTTSDKLESPVAHKAIERSMSFFGEHFIRWTPDGQVVAIDVLRAIGQKNPAATWTNLKAGYPELLNETCSYSFGGRGRPPEVLGEKGVYKLLMVARGPKAAEFREWFAGIIQTHRIQTHRTVERTPESAPATPALPAAPERKRKTPVELATDAMAKRVQRLAPTAKLRTLERLAEVLKLVRGT